MKNERMAMAAMLLLAMGGLRAHGTGLDSPFRALDCSAERIVMELNTSSPRIESVGIEGEYFSRIVMEGSEANSETGAPQLPRFGTLLAIPANAEYSVDYELCEPQDLSGVKPLPVRDNESAGWELSDVYHNQQRYPVKAVDVAPDAWLRDFRVLPLQVCPLSWDPASQLLTHYAKVRITVRLSYPGGASGPLSYSAYSPAFRQLYEARIGNFGSFRDPLPGPRSARILIIHGEYSDPVFLGLLDEFVNWKRQKGFEVSVAGTAVAGSSSTAIKSYIQARYDDPQTRPDYVILLGDTSGSFAVPTFYDPEDEYPGEGDYPYSFLSGSDMLGDVFLGRISAENVAQLVTLFNKIYTYEKNLNLNPSVSSWLDRMLIIGDPTYSGRSCVYVGNYVHEISEQANPEYQFIENYTGGYPSTINSGINQGVGFFAYRGFYGVSGWAPSTSLVNGFRLPHASIITCMTGNFANATSLSEEFVRMGTGSVPAGAITCIGMSTGGTHTAFNNALTAGIMSGIMCHGMRSIGEALLNGKLYMHGIYAPAQGESARKMAHWCNLMGDPSLETWVGQPGALELALPSSLPLGTSLVEAGVTDSQAQPLEGVCVTAFSPALNSVVGKAFSGPDGVAALALPSNLNTELLITASRHNFKPSQQTLNIDPAGSLVLVSAQVVADGNSDGIANASETVSLAVELRNTTASGLTGLSATLLCEDDAVMITQAAASYPFLASGSSSSGAQPFELHIAPNIEAQHRIRFILHVWDSGTGQYQVPFYLDAVNASLSVSSHSVDANGNQILDPGELSGLQVLLSNSSGYPALGLNGVLSSLNSLLTVSDSLSWFGDALASSQVASVDGFGLQASPLLVPGMQMPLKLRLYNSGGFEQECVFNLSVGSVSQNSPLGPDAYGYLIYDDTDTAYPDCPVYDWVEIVPSLGGNGTQIPDLADSGAGATEGDMTSSRVLKQLLLPFPFRFYGVVYDSITVCVNGYVALGSTADGDFRNVGLPGGQGPCPMIAAFWDDLYLPMGSGIYHWYDEVGHRYVIQYHNLKNGYDNASVETFQLIFYDPVFHHSGLGDGIIKIQYQTFNNVDIGNLEPSPWQGNYCTVGIKDHSNTRGLEYTFNNSYPSAAAPLGNGRAILVTTVPVHHQAGLLQVEELIINDASRDGILEPDETAELGVRLSNPGSVSVSGINASLISLSAYATVQNSVSGYLDIPASGTGINELPFGISVSAGCPDGSILSFVCSIVSDAGSWSYPINLRAWKPVLTYQGHYLNDVIGNGNGVLEPGENATLVLNFRNTAPVQAQNLSCSITCTGDQLVLPQPGLSLPVIPPGATVQLPFPVGIAGSAVMGSDAVLNVSFAYGEVAPQTFTLLVRIGTNGLANDFETGNGYYSSSPSANAWQWGSSQVAGSHSGTKVWGTLLNEAYPNGVTWTLTSSSAYLNGRYILEFWHWMDSQYGMDGGNVKISTNNGGTWSLLIPEGGYPCAEVAALGGPGFSGSYGWTRARFDLGAQISGNIRFRWTFASDASTQGQGWFIDDVFTIGYVYYSGLLTGEVEVLGTMPAISALWVGNQAGIMVNPAPDGSYKLYLPQGTHSVKAASAGFLAQTADDIVVDPDLAMPVRDFQLVELKGVRNFVPSHDGPVLHLNWEAPQEPFFPVTGYKVSRRVNAAAFESVAVTTQPSYTETPSQPGTYHYFVQTLYAEGESLPTPIWSAEFPFLADPELPSVPKVTRLLPNYPNPFNPATRIAFELAKPGPAELSIYNLRGQLVTRLCHQELSSGRHEFWWDGRDGSGRPVASGVYCYRLSAPGYRQTRKMLMLK